MKNDNLKTKTNRALGFSSLCVYAVSSVLAIGTPVYPNANPARRAEFADFKDRIEAIKPVEYADSSASLASLPQPPIQTSETEEDRMKAIPPLRSTGKQWVRSDGWNSMGPDPPAWLRIWFESLKSNTLDSLYPDSYLYSGIRKFSYRNHMG